MITSEAVQKVLKDKGVSKYRLSQEMGAAPILVDYWLHGTKMGVAYRELFEKLYGIRIDDNSMEAPEKHK